MLQIKIIQHIPRWWEMRWPFGLSVLVSDRVVGIAALLGILCYVLKQNSLLSHCLSPPWCIMGTSTGLVFINRHMAKDIIVELDIIENFFSQELRYTMSLTVGRPCSFSNSGHRFNKNVCLRVLLHCLQLIHFVETITLTSCS